MSEHDPLPLELREIEARLAALSPAASRLRRDALMYEAGRSAAGGLVPSDRTRTSAGNPWKRAALALAGCLAVSTTLAIHAYTRMPPVRHEIVYVEQESAEPKMQVAATRQTQSAQAAGDSPSIARSERILELPVRIREPLPDRRDYLYQRDLVLRHGVEAVPLPQPAGGGRLSPAVSVRELLEDLLPSSAIEEHGKAI